MEDANCHLIKKKKSELIEETDLEKLLPLHLESEAITSEHVEKMGDDTKRRKLQFCLDVKNMKPEAFNKLVSVYDEIISQSPDHLPEQTAIGNLSQVPASQPRRQLENVADKTVSLREPIRLKMATAFGKSPHPKIPCYSMKSKKRGVFFMINNIKISKRKDRLGAEFDEARMKAVFEQIGFHKKIIYRDLKMQEMMNQLKELSTSDDIKQTDCLFVVIGSHGKDKKGESYIQGADRLSISVKTVLSIFDSKNCPLLHKIPKVFIFQGCRGRLDDEGYCPTIEKDGVDETATIPLYADMIIVYSTIPEHFAFRYEKSGSWLITTLCKVMEENACDTHVEDLFKLTSNQMMNLHSEHIQTPVIESRQFGRYCYLNPGI